jgi:hypothetical protein
MPVPKGLYLFVLPLNRSHSNIPHCWPTCQPGPYFSSSVVDHPLRPTKDRWLGELLIHQQPNLMQIYLLAELPFKIIQYLT